jgi:hypothetical protein
MTDSYIRDFGNGGVALVGPDAVALFRVAALASVLGLLSKGISPMRGLTVKRALEIAKEYTGRTYKRTEIERARADLRVWIETMKLALPRESAS